MQMHFASIATKTGNRDTCLFYREFFFPPIALYVESLDRGAQFEFYRLSIYRSNELFAIVRVLGQGTRESSVIDNLK